MQWRIMVMTNLIIPKTIEQTLNYRKPEYLYHFTSLFHLNSINEKGILLATDSCLNPYHIVEPNVVWFTSDPDPEQKWKDGSIVNKTEGQFIFPTEKLDVYPWVEWAKHKGTPNFWIEALSSTGGNAMDWFVHIGDLVITEELNTRVKFNYEKDKS